MAAQTQDTELLSRIAGGDLVAIEEKYHNGCLTAYKKHYRSIQRQLQTKSTDHHEDTLASRLFAELGLLLFFVFFFFYIESCTEDGVYIFKLSEIHGAV